MTSLCVHTSCSAVPSSHLSLTLVRHRRLILLSLPLQRTSTHTAVTNNTAVTKESGLICMATGSPKPLQPEWKVSLMARHERSDKQWVTDWEPVLGRARQYTTNGLHFNTMPDVEKCEGSILQSAPSLPQRGPANTHVGVSGTETSHYNSSFT